MKVISGDIFTNYGQDFAFRIQQSDNNCNKQYKFIKQVLSELSNKKKCTVFSEHNKGISQLC
jgi:hypothetical protein